MCAIRLRQIKFVKMEQIFIMYRVVFMVDPALFESLFITRVLINCIS